MKYRLIATSGFSLIELMIVVAIIAALAVIAVPQYQTYIIRSRVTTSMANSRPLQLAVAEYAVLNAELPPDAASLVSYGIEPDGRQFNSQLVESVRYSGEPPTITVLYLNDQSVPAVLRGQTLVLDAILQDNGQTVFDISAQSTVPAQLQPRLK